MLPSVGQRGAVRESDSPPPLQSYQEQPNLTFDSDSGGSASGLSTESTPVSGPIEGCPPIDTFSLSSPQLNLPRVVSSRLLSSVQEKPISSRVENEICDDSQIGGNAAFGYLTDNSKEAVEENDDGQINCNVGHYNPETWPEDKCLKYARKLVNDLEDKDWGKDDPSVLEFEKMREKVKNSKKTTPELYHDTKKAEESVALTENNKSSFSFLEVESEPLKFESEPFKVEFEPLPLSISWRLGIIPDSNPNNKGEST